MEKAWAWAKEHPAIAIGAALVVVVVLWLLFRGGSTQTSATGSSDLQAFYAAQAAMAQSGNALQAVQAGYTRDLGIAQAQADVANHQADAQLSAIQATIAGATSEQQINAAAGVQIAGINAGAATDQATIAAGVVNNQTAAGVQTAQIAADTTNQQTAAALAEFGIGQTTQQQANNLAYELGLNTNAVTQNVDLGAQQVQEAQIASDTTLGLATAANAGLEAGYNYNLGVVQSSNSAQVTDQANADALSAILAQTAAGVQTTQITSGAQTQQALDAENAALAAMDLTAAVVTGGQVTTIGPQGNYTQAVINTGGYTPPMNAATTLAYVQQTLGRG